MLFINLMVLNLWEGTLGELPLFVYLFTVLLLSFPGCRIQLESFSDQNDDFGKSQHVQLHVSFVSYQV
jgi:hypothetical protein